MSTDIINKSDVSTLTFWFNGHTQPYYLSQLGVKSRPLNSNTLTRLDKRESIRTCRIHLQTATQPQITTYGYNNMTKFLYGKSR